MKLLVYLGLAVYFVFYLFEGPIRYGFNAVGADSLIFIRDIVLIALLCLAFRLKDPEYKITFMPFYIYAFIIVVHGLVFYANIRNIFVIFYCMKLLLTCLVGAIYAPYIMKLPRAAVIFILLLWAVTFVGITLDKFYIDMPWTGMSATIGDIQVEISRDWEISGADKRAGGFMRSSINAAVISPLLALILMFNIRRLMPRLIIMLMSAMMVYWSTQKASIVAFVFICGLLLVAPKRPVPLLKAGISLAFLLMIFLPVILPQFVMPQAEGVFSLSSFYMRVEGMWPQAWKWISEHEIFPFGVGLGGIGGAQRFYATEIFNACDNMFVLLYGFFGVFSFIYMGWLWWACMSVKNMPSSKYTIHALCIVLFIVFYGVALSMIEDQMSTLFLGAAATWLATHSARRELENNAV